MIVQTADVRASTDRILHVSLKPDVRDASSVELPRQESRLEMIASEDFAPLAVIRAQGSVLTNKYARWARLPTRTQSTVCASRVTKLATKYPLYPKLGEVV